VVAKPVFSTPLETLLSIVFISPPGLPQPKAGLCSAFVSYLFSGDFCQTNYLNDFYRIFKVGRTMAVAE